MKKIPSIYLRDFKGNPSRVTRERNPECAWVFAGEGVATIKRDGTACMIRNAQLFKRYDAKKGKTPPAGFEACGEPDPITGHNPGWLPVGDGPEDKWLREAFNTEPSLIYASGTWECCGPKIQGNPEGYDKHWLIKHGVETIPKVPTEYDELAAWFASPFVGPLEGIVWHHPDGRMAKIRATDFGVAWKGNAKVRT